MRWGRKAREAQGDAATAADATSAGGAPETGSAADDGAPDPPAELVRVVRGQVSDDELAALVAGIVATRAADVDEPETARSSAWGDHGRRLGLRSRPGPDAWRWSARR